MEILIDNEPVKKEFDRWCKHFGNTDPYVSDKTIGLKDVLRAHFLIGDYFYSEGSGIAAIGPRDPNLLHSAVYRQFVSYGGKDKWATPYERCATLLFGLVKDHPFHDANKRTGLLTMLFFLNNMNRSPTVGQKDLEDFIVEIAESGLKRYRRQKELARRTDDPEIYFIADFLRRNSKKRDHRYYRITYRELDRRLRGFSFCLTNPHKNFIDVCKLEKRKKYIVLGKEQEVMYKVAQIGFPGWKNQVGKGAISTVRKETKLTPDKGIDSDVFFRGADPLHSLISEYSAPLERLAYR